LWFLFFLLPSFIAPKIFHWEHRLYVPMAGIIIILAETAGHTSISVTYRKIVTAMGAALLLVLSIITYTYSDNFTSRIIFWKKAAELSPWSASIHNELGETYLEYRLLIPAEMEMRDALKIDPYYAEAHLNLGMVYWYEGKFKDAEKAFVTGLSMNPLASTGYANYAGLCYAQGRRDEAERLWRKSIETDPLLYQSYRFLISYLFKVHKFKEAVPYIRSLRHKTSNPDFFRFFDLKD
jgi:Tfp pilus assembly protein PilF